MDAADEHGGAPSAAKTGQISLLDSGEDFEVLDEEDIDDDLPPLEDAGGGNKNKTGDTEKKTAEPEPSGRLDEWLDVLGM